MSVTKHGANLFDLAKDMNLKIEDFKDFSSNINPFGISPKALDKLSKNLDKASIYPDPNYRLLKENISDYCNCDKKDILLGSGASSFISGFIKILPNNNTLIFSPAYSEYEKELINLNSTIYKFQLIKENDFKINVDTLIKTINDNSIQTAILCNPNNPTGTILTNKQIEKILENTNLNLVIDETYIEFTNTEEFSSVGLCKEHENLFVIRSTSKFFACPGIRLGYAITSNKKIKESFEKDFNILWDINIYADIIGQEMFLDKTYHKQTYKNILEQRNYLYENLYKIKSLKPYKSEGNFILVEITDEKIKAKDLYDFLLQKRIIIRDCKSFQSLGENFFRVCVLKPEENQELIKFLIAFFK